MPSTSSPLQKFLYWQNKIPNQIFLRQPFHRQWKVWTYTQANDEIRKIAAGIYALGLPPKSHIALLSKNCAHWIMADLAIMMAGHVSVPLYATVTLSTINQILNHSEAKAIIIGKLDDFEKQKEGVPDHVIQIGIEAYGIKTTHSWEQIVATSKPLVETYPWHADDLMSILYTSGTTGTPKGVMHTVGNFDNVMRSVIPELTLPQQPGLFSYLPLSHAAERILVEMCGLYLGGNFSFPETLETFAKDLEATQPTCFFAVPRIWTKFREKILEKLPQQKLDRLFAIPLIGSVIKKSIRKKLGLSKVTHAFSGAAPITVDLLNWFNTLGIEIVQGIGMTEDCCYSHCNRYGKNKFGTVGLAFSGVKVKIDSNGELLLKSDSLMKGYYNEPQLTADAFDEEGYLKTGDKVEVDSDGYLTIIGRVKDQFKTDKGKYVSPAPIEMKLLANPDIEQVCVVGMGIPQPIALVVLSEAGKSKTKTAIKESLTISIQEVSEDLQTHEKLEKAVVMQSGWTIENGLMTPTMKIKRTEVEKIHLPKYLVWYREKEEAVWE